MTLPKLIGLTGPTRSGKSTISKYLVDYYEYESIRFADPFKRFLKDLGLTDEELETDIKESPCEKLYGNTPRELMISIGTKWGREMIHPNIWVKQWEKLYHYYDKVIVEDIRFINEYEKVKELGGVIIKVVKNDDNSDDYELSDIKYDDILYNNGTEKELIDNLEGLLYEIQNRNKY